MSSSDWLLEHGFHRDSDDPDTWRRNQDLRVPANTEGPGLSFEEAVAAALTEPSETTRTVGSPSREVPAENRRGDAGTGSVSAGLSWIENYPLSDREDTKRDWLAVADALRSALRGGDTG